MRAKVDLAVLTALFVLLPLSAPVLADENDEWEMGSRQVEVGTDGDGFEFRSDRSVGDVRDRIVLRLDGQDVRFRYKLLEETTSTQAQADLTVEVDRLVEFWDENADGRFQAGENVAAEYGTSDLVLAGVSAEPVSSGDVPGWQATAAYALREVPGFTLAFVATAFGDPTTFQAGVQSPVEIKLDFILSSFPFLEVGTRPALVLDAEIESRFAASVTTQEISFATGTLSAVFRWKQVADVDGTTTPVGVTIQAQPEEAPPGEQEWSVAFAYARGDQVVHDPTFGFLQTVVEAGPAILGNLTFYALGLALAAAVFLGLAITLRRRKVKRE